MHQGFTWAAFFANSPDRTALAIGGVTAVVSAIVGVFTVLRGQSFAGHSLGDVSAAGGSGALLAGLTPLTGFIGLGVIGAGAMELIGIQRVRGRDLATGIVLGAAIGLAALFLYLDTSASATTGAAQQILFGSIFTVSSSLTVIVTFSILAVGTIAVIWRPLLLATVSPDIAAARGVRVRLVGLAYMLALAVAVSLSSLTIGAILATALLIGPAATALHLTRRLGRALILACLIGVAATWAGILLAYDSYYWGKAQEALPVSFFIVAVIFAAYLILALPARRAAARPRQADAPAAADATSEQSAA